MEEDKLTKCILKSDNVKETEKCFDEEQLPVYPDAGDIKEENSVKLEGLKEELSEPVKLAEDLIKEERKFNFVWHGPFQGASEDLQDKLEDVLEEEKTKIQGLQDRLKQKSEEAKKKLNCMGVEFVQPRGFERRENEKTIAECLERIER